MPLAVVHSRALAGMTALPVAVEVHLAGGLPSFNLVGLPDTEVKESRDRVRAAVGNAHFEFPARRITVNLAPADLPKASGRFDLPIALGILIATGQVPAKGLDDHEFAGELALSGALRPVRGALPMALAARRDGRAIVLPNESAAEAAMARDVRVHGAADLLAVCGHLAGSAPLPVTQASSAPMPARDDAPDLADVRGQAHAKRAITIAAAGGHSVLLIGPPGAGKSMLAQRLPGLLPPLSEDEALEVAALASLAGRLAPGAWRRRPFRAPHHTASGVALVGGGSEPRPGEISLAHHGVLFLDELPEWDRRVLEVLREPLETGTILIARATRHASFPAAFQLVTAMNPCPCGWLGHASGRCRCSPDQVARYRGRVSGPLLDRIDMRVTVAAVTADVLQAPPAPLAADDARDHGGSAEARERVVAARARQALRQDVCNARLAVRDVARLCAPDRVGAALLASAMTRLSLSARGYHRVLKVARTIADLAGSDGITSAHVAEALGYRGSDISA